MLKLVLLTPFLPFFPLFLDSQMVLMSFLCSSLVANVNRNDAAYSTQAFLLKVCSEVARFEPEFILKVL